MIDPSTRRARLPSGAVQLAAVLALYGLCCWYYERFVIHNLIDDAFISFRYAENLVRGHGLVYNLGERVEGYTNFLWVMLIAGFMRLGIDPEAASTLLGVACGAATLTLVYSDTRRLWSEDRWAPLVVTLWVATIRTFSVWALTGLETKLYGLLVWLSISSFANGKSGFPWWSVAAAGASLTRPEGNAWFAILLAVAFLSHLRSSERGLARLALPLAVYLAIVGSHETFRIVYYGDWVPNTFRAKVAGVMLARGGSYLMQVLVENHLYLSLPVVAAGLLGTALGFERKWIAIGSLVLFPSYWLVIGGDFFEFRFLDALLPLIGQALWAGLMRCSTAVEQPRRRSVVAVGATVALLAAVLTHVVPFRGSATTSTVEEQSAYAGRFLQVGSWLAANIGPGESLAIKPAGAIAYLTRARCLDILGLNDRDVALRGERVNEAPGHDVWVPPSYARQRGITYWIGLPDLGLDPVGYRDRVNVVLSSDPGLYLHFLALQDDAKFHNGHIDYTPERWGLRN